MDREARSVDILVKNAMETPGMLDQLKADPATALRALATQAKAETRRVLEQDRFIYRTVVLTLGSISAAVVACAITLALRAPDGQAIQFPDILTALGSAAIGALAGILAPAPR